MDEAHAIGVYGAGHGCGAEEGCLPAVFTGSLSKALGSQGGFVAGTRVLIETMVNAARPFIYSTGIAPPAAGAALAALGLYDRILCQPADRRKRTGPGDQPDAQSAGKVRRF